MSRRKPEESVSIGLLSSPIEPILTAYDVKEPVSPATQAFAVCSFANSLDRSETHTQSSFAKALLTYVSPGCQKRDSRWAESVLLEERGDQFSDRSTKCVTILALKGEHRWDAS